MKAKLMINDVEVEVEISEEELQRLKKISKKTGYERAEKGFYYFVKDKGCLETYREDDDDTDEALYQTANYYSSKTVAKNNARADELMRKLRRFAVEHREKDVVWGNGTQAKYSIEYCCNISKLGINCSFSVKGLGIYFDSKETAQYAIDFFYKDLVWYFTEYKDSCSEDGINEN